MVVAERDDPELIKVWVRTKPGEPAVIAPEDAQGLAAWLTAAGRPGGRARIQAWR